MKKSVVIIENDRVSLGRLSPILETTGDMACLGAYFAAEDALPKIIATHPDAVLLEFKPLRKSRIETVAKNKRRTPAIQMVLVAPFEDSERILSALKEGDCVCIIATGSPDQLNETTRRNEGMPGTGFRSHEAAGCFRDTGNTLDGKQLSPREREVLDLLAQGLIYREIGDRLSIGLETVRSHIKNACNKLRVGGRLEAVARHVRNNL